MEAIGVIVDEIALAKAVCAVIGVDADRVMEMTINLKPSEPLTVTLTLLACSDLTKVELPTIGQEERAALLEVVRRRARAIT